MPVVTTVFEFFLLLHFGNCVANRFRTVQSRCFAHSQNRVIIPSETVRKVHSVSDPYAVPTVRNAGPHARPTCYCMPHLRTGVWCSMCCCAVLCYAVVCLCVCVVVYVCFVLFCGYFGNLFGIRYRKVKVYAAFLRCHFLDFFGVFVL